MARNCDCVVESQNKNVIYSLINMATVYDKLTTNLASADLITMQGRSGPALLFTDSDRKLTTSSSVIPNSLLATITTPGKVADSATTASVTNTPSTIVKTDTPLANVNVSSINQTTPDALFIRGNNQSITNSTLTKFTTFTGTIVLNQGSITYSSGDFTIGTAGTYSIAGWMALSANTTGTRRAQIILNGSAVLAETFTRTTTTSNGYWTNVSTEIYLSVNDVITFWCYQDSGANLNMNFPRVSIIRVH